MVNFVCPVCGSPLNQINNSFYCSNRHCFDIAKKGYVNLLLNSSTGRHGDDRLMINARTDFLNKGYYDRLSSVICKLAFDCCEFGACVVDAGCGDGKYTSDIAFALSDKNPDVIGLDISKYALEALYRRNKNIRTAVASTAAIPLPEKSADIILNIFSPLFPLEFHRILKSAGKLIRVIPLENHLIELKNKIYDIPYRNEVPPADIEGFSIERIDFVRYKISLESNTDIQNLFMMTPYYYKTSASDQHKLNCVNSLDVSLEFEVICYRKN